MERNFAPLPPLPAPISALASPLSFLPSRLFPRPSSPLFLTPLLSLSSLSRLPLFFLGLLPSPIHLFASPPPSFLPSPFSAFCSLLHVSLPPSFFSYCFLSPSSLPHSLPPILPNFPRRAPALISPRFFAPALLCIFPSPLFPSSNLSFSLSMFPLTMRQKAASLPASVPLALSLWRMWRI